MISIESLSKAFGSKVLVQNLSLKINDGEAHVVIGPSGAGKSVLLKMIAGLITPDSGQIKIQSPEMSMLFQKNALFDSLTIEDNLLFPLKEKNRITGKPALLKAHALLDAVGLLASKNQMPDEISGGMQKRLGIARALVIEPKIILYDEPTAGLDPITSRIIAELILKLKIEKKSTLVIVTTDMSRAKQLGDHIWMMAGGDWIDAGTPKTIEKNIDPRVRQFFFGLAEGPLTSQELTLEGAPHS